jgi:hypothetical protein
VKKRVLAARARLIPSGVARSVVRRGPSPQELEILHIGIAGAQVRYSRVYRVHRAVPVLRVFQRRRERVPNTFRGRVPDRAKREPRVRVHSRYYFPRVQSYCNIRSETLNASRSLVSNTNCFSVFFSRISAVVSPTM